MNIKYYPANKIREAKIKVRFDYAKIAEKLRQGFMVAISDISPQRAYHIKKKLSKILGEKVVSTKAIVENEEHYVFIRESDFRECIEKEMGKK